MGRPVVSENLVVARNDDLMSARVGSEVVMLHLERNAYYDLDAIGAVIWERLATPSSVGPLIDSLVEQYAVDRETCARDVLAFLAEALTEGVIRIVEAE